VDDKNSAVGCEFKIDRVLKTGHKFDLLKACWQLTRYLLRDTNHQTSHNQASEEGLRRHRSPYLSVTEEYPAPAASPLFSITRPGKRVVRRRSKRIIILSIESTSTAYRRAFSPRCR